LLTAYADASAATSRGRFNRVDPTQLTARGEFGLSRWQSAKWLLRHAGHALRLLRFYKCWSVILVSHQLFPRDERRHASPECFFHPFSPQESVSIQRRAKELGTTLNNLLLRDLFAVVGQWRREDAAHHDNDVVRLSLPLSIRTAAQRALPAANVVTLVCLDRRLTETSDDESLLKSIDDEMEEIRTRNRGAFLPLALRLLQYWPTMLERKLHFKRFAGTVLFSNLGPAMAKCHLPRRDGKFVVGDLSLEQVQFLPVLRPTHCLTLGVTTYAGQIHLGVHFDSRLITEAKAREACERLVSRVQGDMLDS
jgi:hypothetical protein